MWEAQGDQTQVTLLDIDRYRIRYVRGYIVHPCRRVAGNGPPQHSRTNTDKARAMK
jgi:hypothetical protein